MSEESRTVLVVMNDGSKRRVSDIPKDAKITYGPVSPGKNGYGSENALRIYTSASNQLAVFVGVKEFRDEALTVQTQRVDKKSKSSRGEDVYSYESTEVSEWE